MNELTSIQEPRLQKRFDDVLLQKTTEVLGTLRTILVLKASPETVSKYQECVTQLKLLATMAAEVEVKGNNNYATRKRAVAVMWEIDGLIKSSDNHFSTIFDVRKARDLPTALQALQMRGSLITG